MNASEILELVRAGYSKEEITAMDNPQNPQDNPQEKPTSVSSPEDEKKTAPAEKDTSVSSSAQAEENKPDSNLKAFQDSIREMIKSNKELKEVIQASNLQNDSHGNNRDTLDIQAENILKGIIAPVKEDKK